MSTPRTLVSLPADYVIDKGPGLGRRSPARSWLASDAPQLSLDGEWSFRLLDGAPGSPGASGVLPAGEAAEDFAADGYDDSGWESIPVPAHWVLTGDGTRGGPIYTNVQFPFATEPPFVPDENPTGDYRRRFTLPEEFGAMGAVLLRFDGVESRYAVWVNGSLVGVGVGSRLAQEFDITGLVAPGENVIAVRVHQWSASSYLEDQDEWWLPGIFRSVTIEGRPAGGIDDVWLQTPFHGQAGASGSGTIVPEVTADPTAFPVTLSVPELDVHVRWATAAEVGPIEVPAVEPWSAESPRLYAAEVSSAAETVALRIGFRTVRIVGDRFLVNGRRVVFHGMNRPEINPDAGRVFDEEYVRRDLEKMKRFNVNAIRTAHYPPHPRVLELCDELGFWVILENDLETHGFDRDGWAENPSDDPSWGAAYVDRMVRTVERDKNHAAVVMWSLGNEAHTGRNLAAMAEWAHRRDPGRPVHYEGDYTGEYTDVYSRMYPWLDEVEAIGSGDEAFRLLGTTAAEAARQRSKPFLLCEYVHAMGNGPGAIDEYERLVDLYPRLHGGFVWEWRDHGLRTRTADGTEFFAYGGDFGEVVHDGNFLMDGIVLSDGTPSPALHEWAQVVAPIRLALARADDGAVTVDVENRRHSVDASDVVLRFEVTHDGRPAQDGRVMLAELPAGAPAAGAHAEIRLPELEIADAGESWLTVEAVLAADTAWAPAGHRISARQLDLTPTAPRLPLLRPRRAAIAGASGAASGELELGAASFRDGRLVALAGTPVAGPRLDLWRAPTDNDRGQWDAPLDRESDRTSRPRREDLRRSSVYLSSEAIWRREGLDRLVGRVESVQATPTAVHRRTRYAPANSRRAVTMIEHWELAGDDVVLTAELVPTAGWETSWPRLGIRFDLPLAVDDVSWFGAGPRESYPDSMQAALVGRYSSSVDDLTVDYGRPQESGHRSAVRDVELTLAGRGPWLRVDAVRDAQGRLPGFSLRRHTAQQVDAAEHPYELPAPSATYLWVDAAQHGLGSRACGPDVTSRYVNRPAARTLQLVFRAAAPRA